MDIAQLELIRVIHQFIRSDEFTSDDSYNKEEMQLAINLSCRVRRIFVPRLAPLEYEICLSCNHPFLQHSPCGCGTLGCSDCAGDNEEYGMCPCAVFSTDPIVEETLELDANDPHFKEMFHKFLDSR